MVEERDNYLAQFAGALNETLAEMSGLACETGPPRPQPATFVSSGMAAIIGITGARPGRIILDAGRETARKISELINGEEYGIEDEFILYTMAELANIVSGRAMTLVNNTYKGLGMRLTPPSVFRGDKLLITSPRVGAELLCAFTPAGNIYLSVGFERGSGSGRQAD